MHFNQLVGEQVWMSLDERDCGTSQIQPLDWRKERNFWAGRGIRYAPTFFKIYIIIIIPTLLLILWEFHTMHINHNDFLVLPCPVCDCPKE